MLKYNVRAYPVNYTNDFPVVKKEIIESQEESEQEEEVAV